MQYICVYIVLLSKQRIGLQEIVKCIDVGRHVTFTYVK